MEKREWTSDDGRGEAAVGQVREEGLQLAGGQHALVDDRARGERREVHAGLALGALAQHERLAVEVDAAATSAVGDEELAEGGHRGAGGGAEQSGATGTSRQPRTVRPSSAAIVLDLRDGVGRCRPRGGRRCRRRSAPASGSSNPATSRRKASGTWSQDAGAVAGVRLGAGGAAVFEVAQNGERLLDQRMARLAGEGGHEADAAGVVLVAGVVHTLRGRASIHEGPVLAIRGMLGRLARRTHRLSRRRLSGMCMLAKGRRWPSA